MAERLTPRLRRRVLSLPLTDRVLLIGELNDSLHVDSPSAERRIRDLAQTMHDVSGIDVSASSGDRTTRTSFARSIVAFVANMEGYTQVEIGRVLHRDHSTICFSIRRMHLVFESPKQYENELKLYNEFVNAL